MKIMCENMQPVEEKPGLQYPGSVSIRKCKPKPCISISILSEKPLSGIFYQPEEMHG
jgi:hypothetical protein